MSPISYNPRAVRSLETLANAARANVKFQAKPELFAGSCFAYAVAIAALLAFVAVLFS